MNSYLNILCLSDSSGQLDYIGELSDYDSAELTDDLDSGCIASLYRVRLDLWEQSQFDGHPSFWLDQHGVELTLGDYV